MDGLKNDLLITRGYKTWLLEHHGGHLFHGETNHHINEDMDTLVRIATGRVLRESKSDKEVEAYIRRPIRRGGFQARTWVQSGIVTRLFVWLTKFLATRTDAGSMTSEVTAIYRLGGPADVSQLLSPKQARDWLSRPGNIAGCRVGADTDPYELILDSDAWRYSAIDRGQNCFLHQLRAADGRFWEILVTHDAAISSSSIKDEDEFLVTGMLAIISAMVPDLWEDVFGQQPRVREVDLEHPLLRYWADIQATNAAALDAGLTPKDAGLTDLAQMAGQMAGFGDALLQADLEMWRGSLIMLPSPLTYAGHASEELRVVACDGGEEHLRCTVEQNHFDLIVDFEEEQPHSPSVNAFLQQRTIRVDDPSDATNIYVRAEHLTACLAIPLGLGLHQGSKGVLYVFTQKRPHDQKWRSQRLLEIVAALVGQAINANLDQLRTYKDALQIAGGETTSDRLTGWKSSEDFDRLVMGQRDACWPMIMLHLNNPAGIRSQFLGDALRLVGEVAGYIAGPEEKLEIYALNRLTYAVRPIGEGGAEPDAFYDLKTRLARGLRSVTLGGIADRDDYFVWVRASAVESWQLIVSGKTPSETFLANQREHMNTVRQISAQILNRDYDGADSLLAALDHASPTRAMKEYLERRDPALAERWEKHPDPAIAYERARIYNFLIMKHRLDEVRVSIM